MENTKEIFRLQGPEDNDPYVNSQYPIRRVIVEPTGKIKLNPNSENFIYFSRTKRHHAYYIFNKIFKIIAKEIELARNDPRYANFNLPVDFRAFNFHSHVNTEVIKRVKELFENYLLAPEVELVTMEYLNAFCELFEHCATKNSKKTFGKNYPEISDVHSFGGAYGINDMWLELLKQCTVSTKTTNVNVVQFLEQLLEYKHMVKVEDQKLKSIMSDNEALFEMLGDLTYRHIQNPDFLDKNAVNKIIYLLELIEEYQMYPPTLDIGKTFFAEQRRKFKDEYHDTLSKLD